MQSNLQTPNSKLNTVIMTEGAKVSDIYLSEFLLLIDKSLMSDQSVTFWQIFYVSGSLFIKTSICVQLLRLASN
jgi:hypothetical protein